MKYYRAKRDAFIQIDSRKLQFYKDQLFTEHEINRFLQGAELETLGHHFEIVSMSSRNTKRWLGYRYAADKTKVTVVERG